MVSAIVINSPTEEKRIALLKLIASHPNWVYTMKAVYGDEYMRYMAAPLFAACRETLGIGSDGKPLFQTA